jgi:uncharacterized protein YydD (DUF2326 family)
MYNKSFKYLGVALVVLLILGILLTRNKDEGPKVERPTETVEWFQDQIDEYNLTKHAIDSVESRKNAVMPEVFSFEDTVELDNCIKLLEQYNQHLENIVYKYNDIARGAPDSLFNKWDLPRQLSISSN